MDNNTTRTVALNAVGNTQGDAVIYVMSRDQRVRDNFALLAAQKYALDRKLPLMTLFNVYSSVPNRSAAQYAFMFSGLEEVEQDLAAKQIAFLVKVGDAKNNILQVARTHHAAAVFFDFSPLRGLTALHEKVARSVGIPCFVTDTHNIIPVWVASDHQEWAAHTFRRKVHKLLPQFLAEPAPVTRHPYTLQQQLTNDWTQIRAAATAPALEDYRPIVKTGEKEAGKNLRHFLKTKLGRYAQQRNDPNSDSLSNVSAHIHFGQLSSLRVALDAQKMLAQHKDQGVREGVQSYMEEVTVRKELSDNFCYYNRTYDSFEGIPEWGQKTLTKHRTDHREHLYTLEQLEAAQTADAAWNAAQIQMLRTGKMHGYMRMYWAKKILEWTEDPESAIAYTIYLNDKYFLDGYDPMGYTNILWSIGGLHDRPWRQREVYGTVRYMAMSGLRRKFDLDTYTAAWQNDG